MGTDDSGTSVTSSSRRSVSAFRPRNIPAYLTVMGATVLAGLVATAAGYATAAPQIRGEVLPSILFSGILGAFGGMSVMFTASLLNLRKLRPGFERMARGEVPNIPPVWCPVLTSAAAAAEKLSSRVLGSHQSASDPT